MGSCISQASKPSSLVIINPHAQAFFEDYRTALLNLSGSANADLLVVKDQLSDVPLSASSFAIVLSGTPLSFMTASALFDCLKHSHHVTSLYLQTCNLSSDGGMLDILSHSISANSSLKHLDLSDNHLSTHHIQQLSSVLTVNRSLTHLDLSFNPIGPTGFQYLVKSLQPNTSLRSLSLNRCDLSPSSVGNMSALIKSNKNLIDFSFKENLLDKKCIDVILQVLTGNTSIMSFNLEGNDLSSSSSQRLNKMIDRNRVVRDAIDHVITQTLSLIETLSDQKDLESFAPIQLSQSKNWHGLSPLQTVTPSKIEPLPSAPLTDSPQPNSLPSWLQYKPIEGQRISLGHSETIGRRHEMEDAVSLLPELGGYPDASFIGVFDGHGGPLASEFAASRFPEVLLEFLSTQRPVEALKSTFTKVNSEITAHRIQDGTTALVCLVIGNRRFVANAGDSRGVLARNSKAIRLSVDHKPSVPEEEERIKSLGGFVEDDRIFGSLGVSRALGDVFLQPFVSCKPYISVTEITRNDGFLILACDGLWDVCSDDEAVKLISSEVDVDHAAVRLRDFAYKNGSTDNISVVVVKFF
ncbi:hypothetical protein GEMRC1_006451 [Eukaryota sp. GEM-RC1]